MISSCVNPPSRNERKASAISSAEPEITSGRSPAGESGRTETPTDRPIVAGSRPISVQIAWSDSIRGRTSSM
jgi:hypothetical protein